MRKYFIGNVVKDYFGDILIVTNVTDTHTSWVSFSHPNFSGTTKNEDEEVIETCFSCEEFGRDEDCPECFGKGSFKVIRIGLNNGTYLGRCVKDYITSRLLKNFDF